ncbi:MAG: DUF2971 domain-containing protein [Syntrophales bacterium]|jgi:hypothetical protein|nr:DUF2971 domain-containing protein [Syntrophales bacterium]
MPEPTMICRSKLCNREFSKRKLRCPYCNAIGIENLYRYIKYDERAISMLRENQIYFPSAHKLNDPFEFQFHLKTSSVNGIPIDQDSLVTAKADMKNYGVLALSELNNNILMWSHYADSHRGICIEFERTDTNELGKWDYCIPVQYQQELPSFNLHELGDSKAVTQALSTKGKYWEYEQEWRILTYESNKHHPLPGKITAIIFGLNMPQKERDSIVSMLGYSVKYFEALRSTRYYALDIKPVSI